MALSTQSFTQLVRNQVAAIQAAATGLVDFSVGSILRAVVEANAAVMLWLQGLIIALLATTRAATSVGADLTSWMLDFGLTRLAAVAASGQVTFSRFTATLQAVVPIGATVQTADGTQTYAVIVDTSNTAYSATLGGYVIAAGISSLAVPVRAITTGFAGNAVAGAVSVLTTAIAGVDTVSNGADFTNGADAESDPSFRVRFIAYLASLAKATKAAVGYAITSLQSGVTYTLTENVDYSGNPDVGYFYAVVDDGTGSPGSTFLTNISTAIDAVRPIGVSFGVFAPTVVNAAIVLTISTATGYSHPTVVAAVQAAITTYIDALGLGNSLSYTRLIQIAYDTSPGITNVSGLTINGGTADITATAKQTIKASSVAVS